MESEVIARQAAVVRSVREEAEAGRPLVESVGRTELWRSPAQRAFAVRARELTVALELLLAQLGHAAGALERAAAAQALAGLDGVGGTDAHLGEMWSR